jgi:hypothetical protein
MDRLGGHNVIRASFQNVCLAIITATLVAWSGAWLASSYFARVEAERARKEEQEREWNALQRKWDEELAQMQSRNDRMRAQTEELKKAIDRAEGR